MNSIIVIKKNGKIIKIFQHKIKKIVPRQSRLSSEKN